MTVYKSFDELNGKTLEYGDILSFEGLTYSAKCNFLHMSVLSNDFIFLALSISEDDYNRLVDKVYGYRNEGGDWPQPKAYDYEALTRISLVIFAFLESNEPVSVKMPEGNWITIDPRDYRTSTKFGIFKPAGAYPIRLTENRVYKGMAQLDSIEFETLEALLTRMKKARSKTGFGSNIFGYTAAFTRRILHIGCQRIPIKQIQDIYDTMVELRKK